MEKIEFYDNLPHHLKIFAKQLGGVYDQIELTEFWECQSADELVKGASEIGYEIIPAMDMKHNKGYLVGMDAIDAKKIDSEEEYSILKIYFVQLEEHEFRAWHNKIKEHRNQQIDDMMNRRKKTEIKREKYKRIIGGNK